MILHFLRHAQAESLNPQKHQHDRERLLAPEGRQKMELAARGFLKSGLTFEKILSSPYPRAVETAQIVSDVFSYRNEITHSEHLTPEALYHKFRKEFLASWAKLESILIVTHQPFVSECISILLTGRDDPLLSINMGTGTLCSLEIDPRWTCPAILLSLTHADQAALFGAAR